MSWIKKLPVLAGLLGLSFASHGQTIRYVTDSLRLEARQGPSTGHRIIQMMPTGTRLEVLGERSGWSRIKLPRARNGRTEAWILTRYLREDPPPRQALASALAEATELREQNATLNEELAEERATVAELSEERDKLAQTNQSTSTELSEIKRTAASAIAIRDENREIKQRFEELRDAHQQSVQDNRVLRANRERDWFVAGGGVLLLGMVLGLIIPKIRWRRKRGWGEL